MKRCAPVCFSSSPLISHFPKALFGSSFLFSQTRFYSDQAATVKIKFEKSEVCPAKVKLACLAKCGNTEVVVATGEDWKGVRTMNLANFEWSELVKTKPFPREPISLTAFNIADSHGLVATGKSMLKTKQASLVTLSSDNVGFNFHSSKIPSCPLDDFCTVSDGSNVWCFGQSYQNQIGELPCQTGVWVADKKKWLSENTDTFKVSGTPPIRRVGLRGCAVSGNRIIVMGPSVDESKMEIFSFVPSEDKGEWRKLSSDDRSPSAAPPLKNFQLNFVNNRIILTGGSEPFVFWGKPETSVYCFNLEKEKWEKVETEGENAACNNHTSIAMNDKQLLLLGGSLKTKTYIANLEFL